MNETYVESNSFKKLAFKMDFMRTTFLALAFLFANLSVAQVNLTYEFTQSSATYVPTVGGTQIIEPGSDDGESIAIDIGFDFVFDGVVYTQFMANANGNIRLGTSTSGSAPISSSITGAIAFFARDGRAAGGTFTQLSGTAPNRVLTIEYTTYQLQYNLAGNTLNAQIRLFETTNAIEFHYGSSTTSASYTGQVGIRGATAGESNFLNRTSSTDWSATTSGTSSSNTMTLSSTVFPTSGLIFKWMPAPPPVDPPTCVGTFDPASAAMNVVKNPTLTWSGAAGFPTSFDVYFGTSIDPPFAVNVPSATTSYVPGLLMSNTTYYWKVVPKNENGDAIDCAVQSFTTGTSIVYCTPTSSSGCGFPGGDEITNVVVGSYSNPTGCSTPNNSTYLDTGIEFALGTTATVAVSFGSDSNQYSAIWIDFNQDGTFDESEGVLSDGNAGSSGTETFNIMIPVDAILGTTRMRIRGGNNSELSLTQACGATWGESEDYEITILEVPVDPPTCVGTFDPASAAMNVVKNPTLTWSGSTGLPTSYDVYFGTSIDPPFAVNVPSATTSYVPGLLMSNTTYYWKVVPKNENGDAEGCSVQSFTTGTGFNYCASNATFDDITKVGSFSLAGTTKNAADGCVTYTDRTADAPIVLPLGAGVPVSITLGTCSYFYSSYAKVYVDVNQNGTFEDEEMFYGGSLSLGTSAPENVISGTLTVPMSALLGNTRLRLVLREGGDDFSTTACGTYFYGETQDYTVTIADPTADIPSCIATSSPADAATDVVRNGSLTWSGAAGFPTSFDVYFGTSEDPEFVMNVMDASYDPGTLMSNTTYYWKIVPKNENGDAEGCSVQSFTTGTGFNYCASNATLDGDTKVGSFTLAGMTKDAADGCVTYTDRTADAPFVLQQGVGVPVSVALGTCSFTFFGSYAKVFVDVNQNGTFEDEEMFYGGSLTFLATGIVTSGDLTLPMSALTGNTRLRLVLREGGSDVSTTACGTYAYGETQDYTVTVIEPLPTTTQLRTQFCNTTLTTLNENIYANVIVGASMYKFKVVNGDDEQEITRPDSRFSMGFASGIMAGTPYEVSVATEVGGVWSAYGNACTVTTPMVYPTTQLRTEYCNTTLPTLNDNIYADFVVGASMYKFKVVNGMNEQEIERPDSRFSMAFATGIMTGTTYDVSVATMFNGVWSEYGSVCTVTTPAALPTTQLRSSFCNGTVSSLGSNFYASGIVGATAYKFKTMINGEDVEVVRPNARCFMVAFPGAMMDQTYSIEVAVQIGGVWSEYGTACNLTVGTSGVSKQDVSGAAQAFDIKAYPNPFVSQITLSLSNENTPSEIMVYDMTGKLIQQVSTEQTSLEIGNDWSKGIYLVQIVQGQETKSVRIVKQ